jgi:cytochrome c551/c552
MPRTTQIILLGGVALAIVAGMATYFHAAEPARSEPPAAPVTAQGSADDVQSLLNANGCPGCHAIDKKVLGPAYRDVAARYKGDEHALDKLAASIRKGGSERWGDAVMPAMPGLSEAQAQLLAGFVLQQ